MRKQETNLVIFFFFFNLSLILHSIFSFKKTTCEKCVGRFKPFKLKLLLNIFFGIFLILFIKLSLSIKKKIATLFSFRIMLHVFLSPLPKIMSSTKLIFLWYQPHIRLFQNWTKICRKIKEKITLKNILTKKKKSSVSVISLLYVLDKNLKFQQMFCRYQQNCCEIEVFDEKFTRSVFPLIF